jgi:hypothetical protein
MDWSRASEREKLRDRAPAPKLPAVTRRSSAYLAARQRELRAAVLGARRQSPPDARR